MTFAVCRDSSWNSFFARSQSCQVSQRGGPVQRSPRSCCSEHVASAAIASGYAGCMLRLNLVHTLAAAAAFLALAFAPVPAKAQPAPTQPAVGEWSFAVSGDSRNCGDFVMPAIAAKVKAE